jgi:hypothetical protein
MVKTRARRKQNDHDESTTVLRVVGNNKEYLMPALSISSKPLKSSRMVKTMKKGSTNGSAVLGGKKANAS